jgi:energy-coupling factor transport system permease protein
MVATVSTIPILMMTTPMTDMIIVLVEKLKIPFKYAFMFITALRFIPTFMEEMEQILQAQMSRGYHSDTKNPFKKLVIVIPLAIPLLVSSIKKTEKMAISMEVRGFASGPRSYYRKVVMKKADYSTLAALAFIVLASVVLSLS